MAQRADRAVLPVWVITLLVGVLLSGLSSAAVVVYHAGRLDEAMATLGAVVADHSKRLGALEVDVGKLQARAPDRISSASR